MTLLHRWRFHPAFPCPPCIPLSRCCPDRPQPWQRLPRRRLVFLRRVAMGSFFLYAWIRTGLGGVPGRGSIKHCPDLGECLLWRKPIRALSWTGVFAGAVLVFAGVRLVMRRLVLPSQVKEIRVVSGLGRAGLRRLSRRGSWVQIPPPAPLSHVKCEGVFCSEIPPGGSHFS